ncbi:MAG: glycosyltransferase family 10 [Halioglobus sp.]
MRRLLKLRFATWRSKDSGVRPFIEQCDDQNAYIAQRFDLAKYNVVLTEKDPDFLIILNHLYHDIPHPKSHTIGVITEPGWSNNHKPGWLNKYCDTVLSHTGHGLANAIVSHSLCVPWITVHQANEIPQKTKKLSLIASSLNSDVSGTNYQFRHDLVKMILDSDLQCDIYGDWPGNDPRLKGELADKADALLPYEFSVAIENICEPGYATEKLLDCFLAETQPVYLGDPQAPDHYDQDAITILPKKQPLDVLRGVVDGKLCYDSDAVKRAKARYLNDHNLLAQLTDLINKEFANQHVTSETKAYSVNVDTSIEQQTRAVQNPIAAASQIVMTGAVNDQVLEILESAELLPTRAEQSKARAAGHRQSASSGSKPVFVELDLQFAANALEQDESAHLVMLYVPPLQSLAAAIENGEALDSALNNCKHQAESILQIYRGHRRRVTLMELQALIAEPVAALEELGKRTPLQYARPSATSPSSADKQDSTAILIAACAVQEDYDLKQLSKELEAGSALRTGDTKLDLSQQLLELRSVKQKDTESELLLLQLHQIQEELELYFGKSQELEKARQFEQDLNSINQRYSTLDAQYSEQQKQLELTNNILRSTRHTVTQLKQSLSWKITSPLRWMLGLFVPSDD